MRFLQLVFVEFGTLLCLFFIISKSLHIALAFLCCKQRTYNKLRLLLFLSCPSVFAFLYLSYLSFLLLFSFSFLFYFLFFIFYLLFVFFIQIDECLIFSLIVSLLSLSLSLSIYIYIYTTTTTI